MLKYYTQHILSHTQHTHTGEYNTYIIIIICGCIKLSFSIDVWDWCFVLQWDSTFRQWHTLFCHHHHCTTRRISNITYPTLNASHTNSAPVYSNAKRYLNVCWLCWAPHSADKQASHHHMLWDCAVCCAIRIAAPAPPFDGQCASIKSTTIHTEPSRSWRWRRQRRRRRPHCVNIVTTSKNINSIMCSHGGHAYFKWFCAWINVWDFELVAVLLARI